MNLFVADPEWGWWIVLYFFCGGIAAGLYFLAALIVLCGHKEDLGLIRTAHLLAFPLVNLCGIFLILDLNRPERFWHMLLQSEMMQRALDAGWPTSPAGWGLMVQAPMFKLWSPMSTGAWALALFGLFSFFSFLAALWPRSGLAHLILGSVFGKMYQVLGAVVGFFVASYTGVLLTASNQPVWAGSEWIGALFLASAASTGIAVLMLVDRRQLKSAPETVERIEKAELWTVVLELAVFLMFLASLGPALFLLLDSWNGRLLVFGTLLLGLVIPLYLQLGDHAQRRPMAAAVSALIGGLVLRYSILHTPGELLTGHHSPTSDLDSLATIWTWALVGVMLILLVVFCVALYRRVGPSRVSAFLVVVFFVLTGALLVVHASTTYDERQAFWSKLGLNLSPEVGRTRGGGDGASGLNHPPDVVPRSKVYSKE
jgi:formate-dependent nitrite reductase membrane component NrfD